RAYLNRHILVASQHLHVIKLRLGGYTIDLLQALSNFILNRLEVRRRVRAVSRLNRQFANTLEVIIDFVQRTLGRLRDRDTIVSVTSSLRQTLDIGGKAIGDCLASCIVFSAADAQTRGQTLDRRTQGALRLGEIVLGNQSQVVGINDRHG